jgi:uncharacterized protein
MRVTTTKVLALAWFKALVSGDVETVTKLVAPDFRYFMIGNMPASGWRDLHGFSEIAQVVAGVLSGPITMRIGDVTGEGDRVWIEAESDALLTSGGTYSNTYAFALKVQGGKVTEMKEFCDTLTAYEAMDTPQTRGPRKPRQSPLASVLISVQGPTAAQGMA